jgi:hypothetical protein
VEAWTLAHPPQEVPFREDPVMHSYTIVIPSHPCLSNFQAAGLIQRLRVQDGRTGQNHVSKQLEAFVTSLGCLAHRLPDDALVISPTQKKREFRCPRFSLSPAAAPYFSLVRDLKQATFALCLADHWLRSC